MVRGHGGAVAVPVSYDDLRAVKMPDATETHVPVPHHEIVELVRYTLGKRQTHLCLEGVDRRASAEGLVLLDGDKTDIKGPYSSESSVSLMLACELKKELTKRDAAHKLPE